MAVKHPDIDFLGTGRSFTPEETARISAWIREQKAKAAQRATRVEKRRAKKRVKAEE